MAPLRRIARPGLVGITTLLAVGCQWITGARERTFVEPCAGDADCPSGSRCLRTASGVATCVENERATCGVSAAQCPAGTDCRDGVCRSNCDPMAGLECLSGQACRGSVCIGSDPDHDPGAAGASGEAGSGGRPGGGAGGPTGGSSPGGSSPGGASTAGSATGGAPGAPCSNEGEATDPTPGDCVQLVCENGRTRIDTNEADLPVDDNSCTLDSCEGSTPVNQRQTGTGCPGGVCMDGACVGSCNNERQDGNETDIDCGGLVCGPCNDGQGCTAARDCESGLCTACSGGLCNACTTNCVAAECGTTAITLHDACYVLVVREGEIVEELSSPTICDSTPRTFWPRPGDVVFAYRDFPPNNPIRVEQAWMFELPEAWYYRCVDDLLTRDDMIAALNDPAWGSPQLVEEGYPFAGMAATCGTPAAAYKIVW